MDKSLKIQLFLDIKEFNDALWFNDTLPVSETKCNSKVKMLHLPDNYSSRNAFKMRKPCHRSQSIPDIDSQNELKSRRCFNLKDGSIKRPKGIYRTQSLSDAIRSNLQRKKNNNIINEAEFVKTSTGYTILHRACRKKNPSQHTISFILKSDLSLAMEQEKIQGYTPLHIAALKSSLGVVETLIESCPKAAEIQDALGKTPLHLACKRGSYDIAKAIVNVCPQTSLVKNSAGETPLLISLSEKRCDTISLEILRHCPEASSILDKNGDAPLRRAYAGGKSILVLRALLKADPSVVTKPNKKGVSFMDYFFKVYSKTTHLYDIYDLTCIFLRACVNAPIQVSRMDDILNIGSPWYPLHSCVSMNCPLPLFRLFLKSRPDQAKVFDGKGDLPIHIVIRKINQFNATQKHVARSNVSLNFRSKMKNNASSFKEKHNNSLRNMRASLSNPISSLRQLRRKAEDKKETTIVTELMASYPPGAGICDHQGRLPLTVAAENGISWSKGLREIYEAAPRATLTRDTKSHMYPFMLSAIHRKTPSQPCTKQSKEEHLQQLTTTFELLQRSFSNTRFCLNTLS